MNTNEIDKHPLAILLKQNEMYLEEPGDPLWEKARFFLNTEFKLNDPIINETIWKSLVFDSLHQAFNNNPEIFSKRPEWVSKMMVEQFTHLNNLYEK